MWKDASPLTVRLSVVIPCKNEAGTIGRVLRDLAIQSLSETFEVVVADGLSDDGTREVLAKFSTLDLPYYFHVVDNVSGTIPAGLNTAVANAQGEYIVRIDGHCRLPETYLESIIESLSVPGFDIVGPATRYIPGDGTAAAAEIATALNTRLGNGGTASRVSLHEARQVDHTVLSCYRREVWEAIGGYDEGLLTNEDFDFDYRANVQGYRVWSLPSPRYFLVASPNINSLVRQRLRYGYWKWRVVKRHPQSLRMRQILPVLVTVSIFVSSIASFWKPKLLFLPVAYVLSLYQYALGLSARTFNGGRSRWRLPLVYAVIHLSWGSGFLWGMITELARYTTTAEAESIQEP